MDITCCIAAKLSYITDTDSFIIHCRQEELWSRRWTNLVHSGDNLYVQYKEGDRFGRTGRVRNDFITTTKCFGDILN